MSSGGFEHDADMTSAPPLKDPDEKKEHGHGHSHDHDGHDPAKIVSLGAVTLGGATFVVDREGQIESGKETEFGVEHVGGTAGVKPTGAWLANPDGEKLNDPVSSEDHDKHWHFMVTPLMPVKKSHFVLAVGGEEATLDLSRGAQPCNGGILAVFKGLGFLELKLHGDAGDLELWLYTSAGKATAWQTSTGKPVPYDVPKETVLTLTFPTHGGKTETLRVRNGDKNEDEDGTPNMRGSCTNYFIFPGESGADPAWLVGEKWRGLVSVAFEVGGTKYECDPFVLVPHDAL